MQKVKRNNVVIRRGILGEEIGTISNITISKKGVITIKKESK